MPEYASLKSMLIAAEEDALNLIRDRFPIPHYVLTGTKRIPSTFPDQQTQSKHHPRQSHPKPL